MMKTVISASRAAASVLGRGQQGLGWTIVVVALSLATWFEMLVVMGDMDEGPGTPLHDLPTYLTGRVVMVTAMMLPSELNYITAFVGMLKSRGSKPITQAQRMICFNVGAVLMGARHGMVCVGCCWALMAVMFAVGVMSPTWMALLTLLMFAEKVLPNGQKLATPIAVFLVVTGMWIAISPDTLPLLKNPLLPSVSVSHVH